jgi:hypothetical protein
MSVVVLNCGRKCLKVQGMGTFDQTPWHNAVFKVLFIFLKEQTEKLKKNFPC